MTVTESTLDSIKDSLELEKVESHLHPEGSFLVEDHVVPTGREEIWRFTPLGRLKGLHQDVAFADGACKVEVEAADGVTVTTVAPDDAVRGSSGLVPTDRVSARAWASVSGATVVRIPTDTVVEGATIVRHHGTGTETPGAGHAVIVAEKFSKSTVVLAFDGSAVVADNIEIVVEDGAELTVVSLQDWADDAVHLSTQHANVGRDATLKHVSVSFGGDVVRHDLSAEYSGPGGSVEALGLYFADAGQHIEHRLFVDHTAPKTKSHVVYKGALQGDGAHTVWIGNVLIRKVAEGIETYEENRNLVLTDGCQADSVPNLEIETGEIEGAGHASATGRFDDEQLFYLRSRGIPDAEARRLVVHGFFYDLIRKIDVPELEAKLTETVEVELSKNISALTGNTQNGAPTA
ncbi:Fe-S cluster assembly protein SufD [Nocardioides sp. CER19]|uniref:Fe-S cluster assembly protein SufD n=1 Tax=Nocardioides sp. CER19 TaxID=3038538 RepID=UPI00244C51A3|nr:Fe-S cluster assembly protein SufD [Nocardioides sp. CER19]MDH2415775.1 Fe-S cluster assembly protein SufD [Nocardioides sp. CER19]